MRQKMGQDFIFALMVMDQFKAIALLCQA
jgi:hypothetical protein